MDGGIYIEIGEASRGVLSHLCYQEEGDISLVGAKPEKERKRMLKG